MSDTPQISKFRLVLGGIILVVGFAGPLYIPLVMSTQWSVGIKTTLSGLLAFGIPELFMLIAVGVLGKPGYEYLKGRLFNYLKQFAPADTVSLARYRVGLVMFTTPLILGWGQPYLGQFIVFFENSPTWFYIIGDIVFVSSFFVLGGDFWDKFSGLFSHGIKVSKKES